MIGHEIRKQWKKFVLSEGFQYYKGKNNQLVIASNFVRIHVRLDYVPVTRDFYPECAITLCELERDAADTPDAMYNFFDFRTHELIGRLVDNAVIRLQDECLEEAVATYSEEDFETLIEQHRVYFFPTIKNCLTREGLIEFCQKYPPKKLGLVCKQVRDWIENNVPETINNEVSKCKAKN